MLSIMLLFVRLEGGRYFGIFDIISVVIIPPFIVLLPAIIVSFQKILIINENEFRIIKIFKNKIYLNTDISEIILGESLMTGKEIHIKLNDNSKISVSEFTWSKKNYNNVFEYFNKVAGDKIVTTKIKYI